ncbi:outer membrane protein assembly factor BamE [uncultured Rhodospira sp.]|uniref:outer membrane protein assembly factor BamE n=1 Tax=uncultured Rhodospira sp. TaxID=1936189 RepID=UPI00262AFEE8|nr:outer membrane protein assembly factor BamE [uncultured Rhodospira sp.]
MITRPVSRQFRASRLAATVGVCAIVFAVGACAPEISARGNQPKRDLLSEVEAGKQTRAEVAALLGTPSATGTFDNETWYYISARTQQYAVFEREELDRRVVAISFDDAGVVSEVRELDLADGKNVAVVERETPTLGNELGILEQLLGNLGRFEGDNGPGLTQEIPGL